MRNVMTRVLPVPAPARMRTGPFSVSTASRCCGFNELRFGIDGDFSFGIFTGKRLRVAAENFFRIGGLTNCKFQVPSFKHQRNSKLQFSNMERGRQGHSLTISVALVWEFEG